MALGPRVRADVVYVWSNDGTLQKFPTNGAPLLVANNLSGGNGPVGLACDNVGNVYAGVPSGSQIWRFSPNGNNSLMGPMVDSVSGLAFDQAGNLFATIPNYGEVAELNYVLGYGYILNGQSPNYVSASSAVLAFDNAGNFYTASGSANKVEKFSASFADLGAFATSLNQPWGLAFDNAGNLFVSNSGTNGTLRNTIVKFTTNGVRSTFATSTSGLSQPQGLAFDSAGNLYVVNAGNGTVEKFKPDGTSSVFASGLNAPAAIAIYPGLNVWSASAIKLNHATYLPSGNFQFNLVENSGLSFSVLATTNISTAMTNWTTVGITTEVAPGQYQFNDPQATNSLQRFYRIVAPQ